jgi:hypothetical protein
VDCYELAEVALLGDALGIIPENAVAFNSIYGRSFSSNKPVIGEHEEDM